MDTFKRIAKEFWVPAIGAIGWTTYCVATRASAVWDVKQVINIFGPSFFLLSWATGQFFRISKQSHIERNLRSIEGRLGGLVDRLEERTGVLLSQITGGESFCYLRFAVSSKSSQGPACVAVPVGQHTLYEVVARIVDLERMDQQGASGMLIGLLGGLGGGPAERTVNLGTLMPSRRTPVTVFSFSSSSLKSVRVNVFFSAKNGNVTQLIRMVKDGGQWYFATRVKREGNLLFEEVQADFPSDLDADEDWNAVTHKGELR